jgi:ABC transporter substrate binding protein
LALEQSDQVCGVIEAFIRVLGLEELMADFGRREVLGVLGGAMVVACPSMLRAQPREPIRRIGVMTNLAPDDPETRIRLDAFRHELDRLGWSESRNLRIEYRGDLAPRVAQQATETIPIVAFSDDILGAGLVTSLSRPGRNTTGLTIMSPELSEKRLELLQEMVPGMRRVAALWDPTTGASQVSITENAARSMNLELQVLEVRRRDDLANAFRAARSGRADGLNVFASPFLASLFREIIDLSAEHRLAAIYQWKEHVEAGGLLSYGPSLAAMWRQAGTIVVKILGGAKPADLPVQQPTKFELAVNARTAKALGLTIRPR